MIFIDMDRPHLSIFLTKKKYDKWNGKKFRSLKKAERYHLRLYMRQFKDIAIERPMNKPDNRIFYQKIEYK